MLGSNEDVTKDDANILCAFHEGWVAELDHPGWYTINTILNMRAPRGGTHLPIAHTLRLPEPTKKPKSLGCVPPLRSGPVATLRFGRRKVCAWKKEESQV